MAVKLRLQRYGKKGKPFFHIVAADSRAPRDGKFIERIGSYNPNTNPATIQLDNGKAIQWLKNGAQPTYTVRAMLGYTGVLYRVHLNKGVAKGAFSQEEADKRYDSWVADKSSKIEGKKVRLAKEAETASSQALAQEKEVNENRLKAMTAAAEEAAQAANAEAAAATEAAEATAEATEAAPEAEAQTDTTTENPEA